MESGICCQDQIGEGERIESVIIERFSLLADFLTHSIGK
jgi:hypothetical protein